MREENPLVSIGTAVYNGENYLREALDSALSQTYTNFELIISDNASTDKTEEICREYARRDSRISYTRQSKNRGMFENTNFVLQKARGKYFTFLHHDDAIQSNFLAEAVDYMLSHKNCFIVTGDFEIIGQTGIVKRIERLESLRDSIEWKSRCREFFRCPMTHFGQLCVYGLLETKKAQPIFSSCPRPKILMGTELYLISRYAIAGEISSVPRVWRKFRRHSSSTYRIELAKHNNCFFLFLNRCKIKLDQFKVLMISDYPLSQKLLILFWVYFGYFKNLLYFLFVRIPRKVFMVSVDLLKELAS